MINYKQIFFYMKSVLKYVINEKESPFLFNTEILYSEVIRDIKSAGFLSIRYDKHKGRFFASCFGDSSFAGLQSSFKNDEIIIERFLND